MANRADIAKKFRELLAFDGVDESLLAEVRPKLLESLPEIIDGFYAHAPAYSPQIAALLADPELAERLRVAQAKHLRNVLEARLDRAYFVEAETIGRVHEALDVGVSEFLWSYADLLVPMLKKLVLNEGGSTRLGDAVGAVLKVALLDIDRTTSMFHQTSAQRAEAKTFRSAAAGNLRATVDAVSALTEQMTAVSVLRGDIVELGRASASLGGEEAGVAGPSSSREDDASPVEARFRGTGAAMRHLAASSDRRVAAIASAIGSAIDALFAQAERWAAIPGPSAAIEIAKLDHLVLRMRVIDAVVGHRALAEGLDSSAESCRFATFYEDVADLRLRARPEFGALLLPHARVHEAAEKALRASTGGDVTNALAEVGRLNDASQSLLDALGDLQRIVDGDADSS